MNKYALMLCILMIPWVGAWAQENDLARSQAQLGREGLFLNEAASAGLMEVELGKMAQQQASSQFVKEFGRMMERDHSAANRKLSDISSRMGFTPLTKILDDHQKHIDDLKDKSGAEFDKAYMELMVEDHEEDIEKFEKAQSEVNTKELKEWINSTLPILKDHGSQAKTIHEKVKDSE